MSGRIPQSFIDELMSRVDIVALIDEHVPLKKQGKEFVACCPFHGEKTPSFKVNQEKQFYHCFGCGVHGTAIGFLMEYAHLEFREAVETLAARAGLAVPEEGGGGAPPQTHGLYEILGEAAAFYRRQLREHPQAMRAVQYLKGRGLSGRIAAQFDIGFAPPGWDNLLCALGTDEVRRRRLAAAGLVIEREQGRIYDRFRDRIMFPILDWRGRVVGFGGRVLESGEPKYLNSPETPVFHKGRELYGLYQARHSNRRLAELVVVEGYMDVVGLAQHGIGNAVATLGTAATAEHLGRLFRSAPKVVFCFDGDEAGRKAAWRALETALPLLQEGRQAEFLFLPEGEDPDDAVRKHGREAFAARLAEAVSLTTFLFDHLVAAVDLTTLDGRARLVELAHPLLGRLPSGPLRTLATARLSELSGLPHDEVARPDGKKLSTLSIGGRARSTQRPPELTGRRPGPPPLVRRVIALLLHHPRLGARAGSVEHLRALQLPGIPLLVELLQLTSTRSDLSTGALLEHFRDRPEGRHLGRLAAEAPPPLLDEGLEREFEDGLERLMHALEDQRYAALTRALREGSLNEAEKREYRELLTRLTARSAPREVGSPSPPEGK